MNSSQILNDQVILVKRGRMNGLGYEPLWNAYFDFYLDAKWFGESLLELQDVTFHLYLRKNLNDNNKNWKMPTIRQMKKKFGISFDKIDAMMKRLDVAHLLKKESGVRKDNGMTTRNDYILSDPIPTLDEFLTVASEGGFKLTLKSEYLVDTSMDTSESRLNSIQEMSSQPDISVQSELKNQPETGQRPCPDFRDTHGSKIGTRRVPKIGTDQQTLKTKQTLGEQGDSRWQKVLDDLQVSLQAKTFERFLGGSTLIGIADNTAVIGTPHAYARDWIGNRLSDKVTRLLNVQRIECVVLADAA